MALLVDQYEKLSRRYRDIEDHMQKFMSIDPSTGKKTVIIVMNPYMSDDQIPAVLKKFKELELSPYSVYGNGTPSFVRKIPVEN